VAIGVLAAAQGLVFWLCPINRLPIDYGTAELPVGICYGYRRLAVFCYIKYLNDVAKRSEWGYHMKIPLVKATAIVVTWAPREQYADPLSLSRVREQTELAHRNLASLVFSLPLSLAYISLLSALTPSAPSPPAITTCTKLRTTTRLCNPGTAV
jgi:hypothetical protein